MAATTPQTSSAKAYASQSQRTADYTGDPNYVDWEPGRNFKVNVSYKF